MLRGKGPSGEGLDGGVDGGLVALESEEVVAVVIIDDGAGVRGVGVRGVRCDDLAVEVTDLVEERTERRVLCGAVRDLGLADDRAAVMQQPGEQLDLFRSAAACATQPFTVDGDAGQLRALLGVIAGGGEAGGEVLIGNPGTDQRVERFAVHLLQGRT